MKLELTVKKEFEAKTLVAKMNVRHWEDEEDADNYPCREGDMWNIEIDIDSGKITNWEQGEIRSTYFKVCDEGVYSLLDELGNEIVKKDGCYVPNCLAIGENGYGDYVILDIKEDGTIKDWDNSSIEEDFDYTEED